MKSIHIFGVVILLGITWKLINNVVKKNLKDQQEISKDQELTKTIEQELPTKELKKEKESPNRIQVFLDAELIDSPDFKLQQELDSLNFKQLFDKLH
jgi:uncharacterized membrane protein (DUF106 family)